MRVIISLLSLWVLCSASQDFKLISLSNMRISHGGDTPKGYEDKLAIDGKVKTYTLIHWSQRPNIQAWWKVDLFKSYQIGQVIITACNNNKYFKFFHTFSIWLEGEKKDPYLCHKYNSSDNLELSETRSFPCVDNINPTFEARYVKITLDKSLIRLNKIAMAEVTIITGLPPSKILLNLNEITPVKANQSENTKKEANLAIDKNVVTFSLAESSNAKDYAWLQVDLEEYYDVGEVILTADDTYYNQSLQNFAIRLHGRHNSVQLCKDYKSERSLAPRETRPFRCQGDSFQTNIVRIARIGGLKHNLLAIAEVKVKTRSSPVTIFPNSEFGIEIPLAGNLVTQRGTEERDHVGNLATDGNVNSFAAVKTENLTELWWQVDLEGNYHVGEVILTASVKQEYANYLHNFTIWLINEKKERHFCNHYKSSGRFHKRETRSFVCEKDMFIARHIRIEKHGDSGPNTLALAEVAAFSGFSRRSVL